MRRALLTVVVAVSVVSAAAAARARRADAAAGEVGDALSIGGYALVRSLAVDAALTDDTYSATVTHHGDPRRDPDAVSVTAALSSRAADIRVLDGDLAFGSVRAGTRAPSRDTFTVRKRRGAPLDPSQLHWRISARADRLVPPAWAGAWRITARFVDRATGRLEAVDTFTDAIAPDEAIGLSAAGSHARCTDTVSPERFAIRCELDARVDGCIRKGRFDFAGTSTRDAISGRGVWTHTATGVCGWFAASAGQRVEIDARRTSEAPLIPPGGPDATLLMTLAHDPSILQFALR